jgi:hypothetical protein
VAAVLRLPRGELRRPAADDVVTHCEARRRVKESVVQGEILRRYENHPRVALWRQNTGAAKFGKSFVRFGLPGQADLSGLLSPSGRGLFIECKSDRGKQSPQQEVFQRFVEKHGALYVLARTLKDVQVALGF